MATVMTPAPGRSNRCQARLARLAASLRGISVMAPSSTSAAAGADTSSVHRQLI